MRAKIVSLSLAFVLGTGAAAAQQSPKTPNVADIYCSGTVTREPLPYDTYLISGEESFYKTTFSQGDYVYINKGASAGVKVGDQFLVMRAVKDGLKFQWFRWQPILLHAMGTQWKDLGRLRVVVAQPDVSIAQVVYACDSMQRGDYVRPFAERPAPPLRETRKFDRFAPASGREKAMVVSAKDFRQSLGANDVMYVNLGSAQGVKVGDYFRIFRYQGTRHETPYQLYGTAYKVYGFGRTTVRYNWDQLPRDILGEGVVLRVSENAATVLITYSLREIYLGDYAEIE